MILQHFVHIWLRVSHFLPGPQSISAGSEATGVNPSKNVHNKYAEKPSMLSEETTPVGINATNNVQTKTPKHIPKKQARLFLPSFGFFRPIKYNAMRERRIPKPRAKRTGMRTNNANNRYP